MKCTQCNQTDKDKFYKFNGKTQQPCIECKKKQLSNRKIKQKSNLDFLLKP